MNVYESWALQLRAATLTGGIAMMIGHAAMLLQFDRATPFATALACGLLGAAGSTSLIGCNALHKRLKGAAKK